MFRPEREAQVIDGLKAGQPRAAATEAWRRSGARSCRPAARWRRRPASPTSARPAPSASRRRSVTSVRRSCACPARASTRYCALQPPARRTSASCRSRTRPKAWSTRSLDLFLTTPLFIIGETSLVVRHNLLRRENSLDGIQAVCAHPQALAQCHGWLSNHLPQVERRPVSSNAEGARLAARPLAGCDRQRTRRQRVRPARGRAGDPGRRAQPHPLCDRHPPRAPPAARRPRGTTARASSSR